MGCVCLFEEQENGTSGHNGQYTSGGLDIYAENIARVQNCADVTKLNSFLVFVISLLSRHHADQMSEGSEVSKVTLCVKFLKWHPLTQSVSQSLTDQGQV